MSKKIKNTRGSRPSNSSGKSASSAKRPSSQGAPKGSRGGQGSRYKDNNQDQRQESGRGGSSRFDERGSNRSGRSDGRSERSSGGRMNERSEGRRDGHFEGRSSGRYEGRGNDRGASDRGFDGRGHEGRRPENRHQEGGRFEGRDGRQDQRFDNRGPARSGGRFEERSEGRYEGRTQDRSQGRNDGRRDGGARNDRGFNRNAPIPEGRFAGWGKGEIGGGRPSAGRDGARSQGRSQDRFESRPGGRSEGRDGNRSARGSYGDRQSSPSQAQRGDRGFGRDQEARYQNDRHEVRAERRGARQSRHDFDDTDVDIDTVRAPYKGDAPKPHGTTRGKSALRPSSSRPIRQKKEIMKAFVKHEESAFEGERLAKKISRAGLCSRRDAERWVAEGRVSVNGKIVDTPALNVTDEDEIIVDGKALPKAEDARLFIYHKPSGYVTSARDEHGRQTVFDILPKGLPRVVSVGRLDLNTEGLLLLTNDGSLARHLELPATGWRRRYRVRLHGTIRQEQLDSLKNGITIDGVEYGPVEAELEHAQKSSNTWVSVVLREGKNREIRRIFEHFDLRVSRLIRVSYGPFQLQDLPVGAAKEVPKRIMHDQIADYFKAIK
jgi:23S rRNA pseudouridine2605 synthase